MDGMGWDIDRMETAEGALMEGEEAEGEHWK